LIDSQTRLAARLNAKSPSLDIAEVQRAVMQAMKNANLDSSESTLVCWDPQRTTPACALEDLLVD